MEVSPHVCPVCGRSTAMVVDRCGSCRDRGYWAARIFELQEKQAVVRRRDLHLVRDVGYSAA